MVGLEGFEPPTHGLGNRCSILLSYRPTCPSSFLSERAMPTGHHVHYIGNSQNKQALVPYLHLDGVHGDPSYDVLIIHRESLRTLRGPDRWRGGRAVPRCAAGGCTSPGVPTA